MESKNENHIKEDEIYMPSPPVDVAAFERTLKTYAFDRLQGHALQGTIRKVGSRVFCWRVFLGILSPNGSPLQWAQELSQQRKSYYDRFTEFKITTKNFDPNKFNPLMAAGGGDNPYNFLFKDADLKSTIRQDIERTYQEAEFFRQSYVKDQMMSILFLWSRHNQDISYRQGMNEILGSIFFLFHSEKLKSGIDESPEKAAESAESLLKFMNNEKHLVPDMFLVFDRIMQMGIKELFLPYQSSQKTDLESRDKVKSLRKTEELFYFNFDRPSTLQIINDKVARDLSPLMKRCNRIYNFYLKLIDRDLYDHLLREKIEPQIHLTRWLRCMLNRQFHIEDVLKFWDAIFSLIAAATRFNTNKPYNIYDVEDYYEKEEGDPLVFLDVLCVTMISYVRSFLLESDTTGCLQRLMKYPPLEDPQILIKRALEFRRYLFRKEKFPEMVAEPKAAQPVKEVEDPLPSMKKEAKKPAIDPADPLFQEAPKPRAQKKQQASSSLFDDQEPSPPPASKFQEPPKPSASKKKTTGFSLLNPLAALAKGGQSSSSSEPRESPRPKSKPTEIQKERAIQTSSKGPPRFDSKPEAKAGPPRFEAAKRENRAGPPRFESSSKSESKALPPKFESQKSEGSGAGDAPPRFEASKEEEPAKAPESENEVIENPLSSRGSKKPSGAFGLMRFEAQPSQEQPSKYYHVMEEEQEVSKGKKKKGSKAQKKGPALMEEPSSILSMTKSFMEKGKKERELVDHCRLVRTVIRKTKDNESFDPANFARALTAVDQLEEFIRENFKQT